MFDDVQLLYANECGVENSLAQSQLYPLKPPTDADAHALSLLLRGGVRVVFEDDCCAVVFKPAGNCAAFLFCVLICSGFHTLGRSRRTLGFVLPFLLRPSSLPDVVSPSPAHRLDARVQVRFANIPFYSHFRILDFS
jgi:hypothetical protein